MLTYLVIYLKARLATHEKINTERKLSSGLPNATSKIRNTPYGIFFLHDDLRDRLETHRINNGFRFGCGHVIYEDITMPYHEDALAKYADVGMD